MLLLLPALLVACGDDDASSSSPSSTAGGGSDSSVDDPDGGVEPIRLRVGLQGAFSGIETALSEASAVGDGAHVEIEWIPFESSREAMEALSAGAVDVAASIHVATPLLAAANATEEPTADTVPFRIIAVELPIAEQGFNLIVKADSDVRSFADLVGRRVSFSPGALGHYFFLRQLELAGLEPGAVEEVHLPPGEGRAAFLGGSVDAIIAGPNATLALVEGGDGRVVATSWGVVDEFTVTVVRRDLLDDPAAEAALAELVTILEARNRWASENPETIAEAFETDGGFDATTAEFMAAIFPKQRARIDDEVLGSVQEQLDAFHSVEVAQRTLDVSILFDDRFNEPAAD